MKTSRNRVLGRNYGGGHDLRAGIQETGREIPQRVEEDNKRWKFESIFLPNVEPAGSVDYVLLRMEPSLGGWVRSKGDARFEYA